MLGPALAAFQKAIVQAASPLADLALPETLEDLVKPDLELAPLPGEVQQLTIRGIPCVFPFHFQGKEHSECIAIPAATGNSNPNATCVPLFGHGERLEYLTGSWGFREQPCANQSDFVAFSHANLLVHSHRTISSEHFNNVIPKNLLTWQFL